MEQFSNILPEDFDGVFRFSNWSEEDFIGKWGNKEYLYPALKTTPMFIHNATPLEVQNIRKKFAKDLSTREYFKSEKYKKSIAQERNPDGSARFNSFQQSAQYDEQDLKDGIQKCLTDLPIAQPLASDAKKIDIETQLSRDEEGELNTQVVKAKGELKMKNKE